MEAKPTDGNVQSFPGSLAMPNIHGLDHRLTFRKALDVNPGCINLPNQFAGGCSPNKSSRMSSKMGQPAH